MFTVGNASLPRRNHILKIKSSTFCARLPVCIKLQLLTKCRSHNYPPELNLPWSFQPTKDCRVVFYRPSLSIPPGIFSPSLSFPPAIKTVQIKKYLFGIRRTAVIIKRSVIFFIFMVIQVVFNRGLTRPISFSDVNGTIYPLATTKSRVGLRGNVNLVFLTGGNETAHSRNRAKDVSNIRNLLVWDSDP